jgi:hypothetical protein
MELSRDFSEFIGYFVARDVQFLVVGGYAMAAHGHPRYTKDLDVWVRADRENGARILQALDDFGFGDVGLTLDDFLGDDTVVQLGREPHRIDLLTFISGVEFDEAWENHVEFEISRLTVPVIGRADLRRNKLATGRLRDLADAEELPPADVED